MTEMTEEWVSLWYQCLARNEDYIEYCDARREKNRPRCKQFERKFEHIADIFDDFDDVSDGFDGGMNGEIWKDWFEPRRHLFLSEAGQVEDSSAYVVTEGHLLLDVPLSKDEATAQKRVKRYLAKYYAANKVVPAAVPKYRLHMNGSRVAHGLKQVRQACIVGQNTYLYPLDFTDDRYDLPYKEVVGSFFKHEIDNLGWTLDPRARAQLNKTGLLPESRFDSFKVRLNKSKREFKGFASNVIRNRFPDVKPYDSRVIEHFAR